MANIYDGITFYTLQETAEILRLTEHTIYLWCRSGKLKASKPGRKWLIPASEIQKIINGTKNQK